MSEIPSIGKRRRRPQKHSTDGPILTSTGKRGRPKKARVDELHHRTTQAQKDHADNIDRVMKAMLPHYKSIREFLWAFLTNPHLDTAHQNFFQCGFQWNHGHIIVLYLQPVLNPTSYDGVGILLKFKHLSKGDMAPSIANQSDTQRCSPRTWRNHHWKCH